MMPLARVLAVLLMSQSGHTFFSDAVPPWSCIQADSVLFNTCLNPGVNTSPLVHETSGSWVGDGFSGAVRVFFTPANDTSVAVKTFREPLENESEDDYVSVIRHEYYIAERLQHPNIVATYDLYTDGVDWHQIMEYCPVQLQEVVKSRKMSQNEVGCIFKGIVEGVGYMHDNSIAHLDLKLSNIMLSLDGSPKIIDFGSAVSFGTQNKSSPTVIKGIRGALPYAAPEVLGNHAYDPSLVDIWALGIIFVCMTLRQCPWLQARPWDQSFRLFTSTDDSFASANHTFSPPELSSLDDFNIDRGPESLLQLLPQPARKIIGKMLDLNSESRPTIEDLRSDEWYNGILGCQGEDPTESSQYESPSVEASGAERIERFGFGYAILFSESEEQQDL